MLAEQKYAEALAGYSEGIKLRPSDASYICNQANALAKLNRNVEAMADYHLTLQIRPELSEAHFQLAGLLGNDNQLTEAARNTLKPFA